MNYDRNADTLDQFHTVPRCDACAKPITDQNLSPKASMCIGCFEAGLNRAERRAQRFTKSGILFQTRRGH